MLTYCNNRVSSAWDQEITPIPNPNTSVAIEQETHLEDREKLQEAKPKYKIFNLELFELENTRRPSKILTAKCKGYQWVSTNGQLPHSTYPLALHDIRTLLWTCRFDEKGLTLFAQTCSGWSEENRKSCRPCQLLAKNRSLEGILTRMAEGTHINLPYAYHGFQSLQGVLQQKNQALEFYRFRGLNQARKLLGKEAALSEQKRLLMAIASEEVQHIDRVISIGLLQKKRCSGTLAAAQGHYHPKSYTEEEDMRALLIWRLSGNRVSGIYQKLLGGPGVTYLRTCSIVPRDYHG